MANEPRSYREAIAAVFRVERPNVELISVEPQALDCELARFQPHMVVHSEIHEERRPGPLSWVMLYPDLDALVVVSIGNKQTIATDIGVRGLVEVIDKTCEFVQSGTSGRSNSF